MLALRLNPPLPVEVVSTSLPEGVEVSRRSGWAHGWYQPGIDAHLMWIVAMDDGGAVLVVPNPEIRMDTNWSYGRNA